MYLSVVRLLSLRKHATDKGTVSDTSVRRRAEADSVEHPLHAL